MTLYVIWRLASHERGYIKNVPHNISSINIICTDEIMKADFYTTEELAQKKIEQLKSYTAGIYNVLECTINIIKEERPEAEERMLTPDL